ncbi:hypothetical protein ACWGLF_27555 [Streptomyces puniciscabiei]
MNASALTDTVVRSPMANLATTSLSATRELTSSALAEAFARVQAESNQAATHAIAGFNRR